MGNGEDTTMDQQHTAGADRVEVNRGAWAGYRGTVIERDGFAIRVQWDHNGGYKWLHQAHVIWLTERD